jgi:hypothetical protein
MVANLPPELQADIAPGINKIFYWVGTLSALVGGTVGATGMMGMIPNILEFMKPGPSVAAAVAAAPVMSGGGGIPTVKEITEAMLNSSPPQTGGAQQEGTVFMGVLAFTVFAGLTLALVRGKHFPSAK